MNEQAIEAKKTAVRKAIDGLRPQLIDLAEKIHQNPETKFEEIKAAQWLSLAAADAGFKEYQEIPAKRILVSAIRIGAPVSYERAVKVLKAFEGIVEQASEDELADAAARADRAGLYACPQTGVALAVLTKLVSCGEIKKSESVVVISTAHGLKFTEMKVGYHEGTLAGVTPRHANPPLGLPADVAVVKERIVRLLNHRVLS